MALDLSLELLMSVRRSVQERDNLQETTENNEEDQTLAYALLRDHCVETALRQ